MCLAIPGKLLEIIDQDPLIRRGKASFAGIIREVSLTFVPEAKPGDFLLVHVGVAISVVDPAKAMATMEAMTKGTLPRDDDAALN